MTSTPTQRTTDLAEHLTTELPGMVHERITRLLHEERVDLVPGRMRTKPSISRTLLYRVFQDTRCRYLNPFQNGPEGLILYPRIGDWALIPLTT